MAEELLGGRLRHPRRRLGPRLPPPRERGRADARRARARARADLDAQRHDPVTGEKMAKSVGNIAPLHEVLERYGAEAVVMYLVSGHYRQPLAFSRGGARAGRGQRQRIREARRRLAAGESEPAGHGARCGSAFFDALRRDFNTPEALAALTSGCARPTGSGRRAVRRRRPARDARGPGPREPAGAGRAGAAGGRRAGRAARAGARASATSRPPTSCASEIAALRLGGPRRRRGLRAAARCDPLRAQPRARGAAGAARARPSARCGRRRGAAREPWLAGVASAVGARRGDRAPLRLAPRTRASAPRPGPTPTPRPAELLAGAGAAARRARPGPGPAEPRLDLPHGRVRGRRRAS